MTFERCETGIPGFDRLTGGGLPRNRLTVVAGTVGSGKTVFAAQFLVNGVRDHDEPGVFVSFEEPVDDLRENLRGFGWDLDGLEATGKLRFVDASPSQPAEPVVVGPFDFEALRARLRHAVEESGARRVVLDSLDAVFQEFPDPAHVRRELRWLVSLIKELGLTVVTTAERSSDYGATSRFGVEEFVASNVIVLRNVLEEEAIRRTVQVLKLRGVNHKKGEFPITIVDQRGMVVVAIDEHGPTIRSDMERVPSGVAAFDPMLGGGLFRDSVTLVSGTTGTGKTLLTTHFVTADPNGRSLLFSFEENREQLLRNAAGWGADFAGLEAAGKLRIVSGYPESVGLEDHMVNIQAHIDDFQPTRFAFDSLSALERVGPLRAYRHFEAGLTALLKERRITSLYTSTTPNLLGGDTITTAHLSTMTDTIVLLRYVELRGRIRRSIAVLKMRGSAHDVNIHEFTIDGAGLQIGEPFREVSGILGGAPRQVAEFEAARLTSLFDED